MAVNRRKIFGGLEAVLGVSAVNLDANEEKLQQELRWVMVNQLVPGKYQQRKEFNAESLQELSDSIRQQGVLQPIVVREHSNNEFEIIAGERRWRAAQMAGLQQVPVVVCRISDISALAFGLIENIQRQDLNPIEEASALKQLIEDFRMTHEDVAKSIGRSRASVSNALRLLSLIKPVQDLLISRKLDVGHAKLLLTFKEEEQQEVANIIVDRNLTVRGLETFLKLRKSQEGISFLGTSVHPSCKEWSNLLSKKIFKDVAVKLNQQGKGRVIIKIDSTHELEQLIKRIT